MNSPKLSPGALFSVVLQRLQASYAVELHQSLA